MANVLFPAAKQGFLDGSIDLDTAVIKVTLLDGYTYDSTDVYVSDMSTGTWIDTPETLASKTVTGGVFDAADISFAAVAAGGAIEGLLIYQASAVTGGADVATSAQRLIAYIDSGVGLPVTPNGADISVAWDNGASKIFAL